jgi:2-keto-4-pentenoate hydratase
MQRLSIGAPLVGFLTDQSLVRPGAVCSLEGWVNPIFELEVAVHMSVDLARASDPALVSAAIGGLSSAIELVDVDSDIDVVSILGTNIFHRLVMVGPAHLARAGGSVAGLAGHVTLNGETVATTRDVEAIPGPLLKTVAHVAAVLSEAGKALRKGDVIICGSVVEPVHVQPGDIVQGSIDPLGAMEITLAP